MTIGAGRDGLSDSHAGRFEGNFYIFAEEEKSFEGSDEEVGRIEVYRTGRDQRGDFKVCVGCLRPIHRTTRVKNRTGRAQGSCGRKSIQRTWED